MSSTKYSVWKWLFLWNSLIAGGTIQVGLINKVSFNVPAWSGRVQNGSIQNRTCQECLCAVLSHSFPIEVNSSQITSFNCFNHASLCQFFTSGTFYQFWLTNNTNSTFYFLQMPAMLNNSGLVAWHTFDGGSQNDSSGNSLNAMRAVNITFVSGRINQAVSFTSNSSLYEISNFVGLGQVNAPYSIALWIRPSVLYEMPIVHLSQNSDGTGWCIDMFGLLSNGRLAARSWANTPMIITGSVLSSYVWSHIAATYDLANGLRLYINGTLINSTVPFGFFASGSPMYLTLGSSLNGVVGQSCNAAMIAHFGTFNGLIDDLRVYARELTANDVYALANP